MTSESFAEAINRSMAEIRKAMQEKAERLEAEFRRLTSAAADDEGPSAERDKAGNEQLREMIDSLRVEASRAAGQFSEGMSEMMGEFRRLLEATMPGWGESESGGADAPVAAAEPAAAPAKKATKSTAEKSAKKATKKAAKKSTAEKSAKKATKKAAKKSTAKKAAKKSTAKKAAKKSTAKKAAKKSAKKTTKKAR